MASAFDAWVNRATGRAYALTPDPLEELGAALWRRVAGASRRRLPVLRSAEALGDWDLGSRERLGE